MPHTILVNADIKEFTFVNGFKDRNAERRIGRIM